MNEANRINVSRSALLTLLGVDGHRVLNSGDSSCATNNSRSTEAFQNARRDEVFGSTVPAKNDLDFKYWFGKLDYYFVSVDFFDRWVEFVELDKVQNGNAIDDAGMVTKFLATGREQAGRNTAGNGSKNGSVQLVRCFQDFCKEETLDESNSWYCNVCKGHKQAMKTVKLWR